MKFCSFFCWACILSLVGCAQEGPSLNAADAFGNLLAFNHTTAPVPPEQKKAISVHCPRAYIRMGGAYWRLPEQSDDTSVRFQLSISETMRECKVEAGKLWVKVGASGNVLLGPSGIPGTVSAPLYITLQKEVDQPVIVGAPYWVQAVIPKGETNGTFTLVSDWLSVPYVQEQADLDYAIFVGFKAFDKIESSAHNPRARSPHPRKHQHVSPISTQK